MISKQSIQAIDAVNELVAEKQVEVDFANHAAETRLKQIERLENWNNEMAELLDRSNHTLDLFSWRNQRSYCSEDCPRCRWEALKKEMKG